MPVPATSGTFRTKLEDMQIGDYIACKYTAGSGAAGVFSDLGADAATVAAAGEIAVDGDSSPHQFFYLIKTDKGMLISDRVVQHSISWDTLNAAKLIQGINCFESDITLQSQMIDSGHFEDKGWAFDNILGGYDIGWEGNPGYPSWVGQDFKIPIVINKYSMVAPTDYFNGGADGSSPYAWNFEGSNDMSNWDILDTQSGKVWYGGEKVTFAIANTIAYRYYRINITSQLSGGDTCWCMINEIEMFAASVPKLVRSLVGGVAYMGSDNLPKLTDQGLGAWPSINEWDTYIVNSNLNGKITAGDDNVWHWNHGVLTICKETPIIGMRAATGAATAATATSRINRSYNTTFDLKTPYHNESSGDLGSVGFRPVFEFLEADAKASNFWY